MTVKTISKSLPLIDAEIRAMNALINKRVTWLEKPENRMKSTFNAVNKDTEEMRQKREDLENEKNDLLNPKTH